MKTNRKEKKTMEDISSLFLVPERESLSEASKL